MPAKKKKPLTIAQAAFLGSYFLEKPFIKDATKPSALADSLKCSLVTGMEEAERKARHAREGLAHQRGCRFKSHETDTQYLLNQVVKQQLIWE